MSKKPTLKAGQVVLCILDWRNHYHERQLTIKKAGRKWAVAAQADSSLPVRINMDDMTCEFGRVYVSKQAYLDHKAKRIE